MTKPVLYKAIYGLSAYILHTEHLIGAPQDFECKIAAETPSSVYHWNYYMYCEVREKTNEMQQLDIYF